MGQKLNHIKSVVQTELKHAVQSEIDKAGAYLNSEKGIREIERAVYSFPPVLISAVSLGAIGYDYAARFFGYVLTQNNAFLPQGVDPVVFTGTTMIVGSWTAITYINRREIKEEIVNFFNGVKEMPQDLKDMGRDTLGVAKWVMHQAKRL